MSDVMTIFSALSKGSMAVHAAPPGKRKEIYKYEAPWTVYSMNWSIRPDKRFRLALGSFVEEYNNKVCFSIHWFSVTVSLTYDSVLSY